MPDLTYGEAMGKPADDLAESSAVLSPRDPWRHRSAGMKCGTCMWFAAKVPDLPPIAASLSEEEKEQARANLRIKLGRCRRRAPTMSGYPAVFPTDWCGDHKLDENAV